MPENLPACPLCACEYTYEMNELLVCPECAHEWSPQEDEDLVETERVVKDASGNILQDGDTVTIVKDLKVKGSSTSVKVGTKVKNIRLISPIDGHDIDAKVDGFGSMYLKSSIVKKVL
jgi:protein PhnA